MRGRRSPPAAGCGVTTQMRSTTESGKNEVYVRAFPPPSFGPAAKWQISNSGGVRPFWLRNVEQPDSECSCISNATEIRDQPGRQSGVLYGTMRATVSELGRDAHHGARVGVRAAAGNLGAGVDEQPVGYGRQHSVLLVRHGEPDPQIRRSELAGAVDGADGAAAAEPGIYGAGQGVGDGREADGGAGAAGAAELGIYGAGQVVGYGGDAAESAGDLRGHAAAAYRTSRSIRSGRARRFQTQAHGADRAAGERQHDSGLVLHERDSGHCSGDGGAGDLAIGRGCAGQAADDPVWRAAVVRGQRGGGCGSMGGEGGEPHATVRDVPRSEE